MTKSKAKSLDALFNRLNNWLDPKEIETILPALSKGGIVVVSTRADNWGIFCPDHPAHHAFYSIGLIELPASPAFEGGTCN